MFIQQCYGTLNISNTFENSCSPGLLDIGTICKLSIKIVLPQKKQTSKIHVELFTLNVSDSFSFGLPEVTFGKNYEGNYRPTIDSLIPGSNKIGVKFFN